MRLQSIKYSTFSAERELNYEKELNLRRRIPKIQQILFKLMKAVLDLLTGQMGCLENIIDCEKGEDQLFCGVKFSTKGFTSSSPLH